VSCQRKCKNLKLKNNIPPPPPPPPPVFLVAGCVNTLGKFLIRIFTLPSDSENSKNTKFILVKQIKEWLLTIQNVLYKPMFLRKLLWVERLMNMITGYEMQVAG
jgi:hypothetical protein